jgi:transcriptional regulator with XRE-family HTH domain
MRSGEWPRELRHVALSRMLEAMTPIHLGRVRELRDAKGWSQAQLAERASVRIATISDIENAKTRRIDLDTLEKLANALDVDASYLIVHERTKRGRR